MVAIHCIKMAHESVDHKNKATTVINLEEGRFPDTGATQIIWTQAHITLSSVNKNLSGTVTWSGESYITRQITIHSRKESVLTSSCTLDGLISSAKRGSELPLRL